ncbi:Mitogen-activated protein kinase-binding protein 1 [Triplophysa tibetana]|uniref:Mitogen-activated protein kinase-binding protein 1 n=1 Tax=Triplophysa tibetana TaxID=1572043 RepID=A0A5A9NI64_9TELE|nr:Mitogen-activated protein kinase-binding protein 1 [Triplophysa tibetana]
MDGSIRSRIKSLLRSPSIRLRKSSSRVSLSSQVTLERVVGITASGNSSLTCDPCSGTVAFPAGCVVVLLNPSKHSQQHLINPSRRTITALSFSSDGKYLVTGEVAELQEHKYAVSCVTFSPNTKYIVSVGSQHDMSVNLWVWKRNTLVATNKVSSKVTAVAFSDDSSYFVTAGNRHVRFWYLEPSRSNKLSSTVPLMGRSGLLGELQNNFFCDVACGRGLKSDSTFCVTSSGLLCEFNDSRVLEKWVHLQVSNLNPDVQYPDSMAVTYDPVNGWLSCVYDDHSVYVWDTRDLQRVLKVHSALYHSDSVWDLQMFPKDTHDSRSLPGSSGLFFSCSSDSTVRLWSSDNTFNTSSSNLFSRELHEVIYMNDNSAALLDVEGTAVSSSEKSDGLSSESGNVVRSICVSPDGRHLASGDRSGTLSDGEVKLISCGADKSLYFHTAHRTTRGTEFLRTRHVVRKTTFCDMTIDPSGRYAVVGCQDRSVRCIEMDPSGVYVAVSCSDKTISLFDFRTGECLATVFGHSEIISSLVFTDDCKYLISASGDSCMFVWRLAPELTMNMRERLCQRKRRQTVQNTSFRRSSGFTLNVTSCYPESERDEDDEEHQKSCQHQSERSVEEEPRARVEWNTEKVSDELFRLICNVQDGEVPPQPRRRWSSRVGSLELMVKSMLELRQLDSLSKGRSRNRDFTGGLQERSSTSSLKDGSKKRRVRPHSAWLAPASTPEPEGVVLYSEEWPNRITSKHLHTPADVCHSPSSGFPVGYCSAEAGPDQHQHDSDECSDEDHTDRQQISQDVCRKHQMVSGCSEAGIQNRPEGASTRFHAQRSSRRTSTAIARPPTDKNPSGSSVQDVREPVMWSSPQRNHPYLSRGIKHPEALQKSASVHNLSTDWSLTPTRVRRDVLKTECRAPSHHMTCLQSWESPNLKRISRAHSYMSPTTSSRAKISRSVSIGDLKSTSCESLCPSTTAPGEGKASVKAAVCPRTSSPFAEWPSRSASTHPSGEDTSTDLESGRTAGDPEAVIQHRHMFSDARERERPRVAVKAFSVQSDAPAAQGISVCSPLVCVFSFITLLSLASLSSVRVESVEDMRYVFELCVYKSTVRHQHRAKADSVRDVDSVMLFFRSVCEFGGVQTGCC